LTLKQVIPSRKKKYNEVAQGVGTWRKSELGELELESLGAGHFF